jgi:hypothetical protein
LDVLERAVSVSGRTSRFDLERPIVHDRELVVLVSIAVVVASVVDEILVRHVKLHNLVVALADSEWQFVRAVKIQWYRIETDAAVVVAIVVQRPGEPSDKNAPAGVK